MKRLHEKVNIVPVIAKSDTMTSDECRDFKKTVSWSQLPSTLTFFCSMLSKLPMVHVYKPK